MEWVGGLAWGKKKEKFEEWHDWWAWFPVMIDVISTGHKVKAWLQTVERKGNWINPTLRSVGYWEWVYRRKCSDK